MSYQFTAYQHHEPRHPSRKLKKEFPTTASTLPAVTRRRVVDVKGQEIQVGWLKPSDSNLFSPDRRDIEELVAQVAAKFGETQVHIEYGFPILPGARLTWNSTGLINWAFEVNKRRNQYAIVHYDEHVVVSFPKMDRKAHVYIVKEGGEFKFRPLEKNKDIDKRPAVVLI